MATTQSEWDYAQVNYKVKADQYGRYIADSDNPMIVDSVVDAFGSELDASKYVVIYLKDATGNGLTDGDAVVTDSVNGVAGAYPKTAGNYVAVVYAADEWAKMKEAHSGWFDADGNPITTWAWSASQGTDDYAYKAQPFRIAESSEAKSLEDAAVFQVSPNEIETASADRENFSDTTFKYLGSKTLSEYKSAQDQGTSIKVAFDVDGQQLTQGMDYVIDWSCSDSSITAMPKLNASKGFFEITDATPATYTATLYGMGDYEGSEATVKFSVDPIDLSKDTIAIETQGSSTGYSLASSAGDDIAAGNSTKITVNGEPLLGADGIDVVATQFEGITGETVNMPTSADVTASNLGVYTFKIAAEPGSKNPFVVGGPASVDGMVVSKVVKFYYGNQDAKTALAGMKYVEGGKNFFDPDNLSANTDSYNNSGTEAKFTCKVTKDGKEVTSYDEAGTYVVTLDSAVTAGFASAGHEVATFTVANKVADVDKAFFQVDGKAIDGTFYYTGEPYSVDVVAYDKNKNVLTEDEDYTVVYKKDGKVVDSMVDAGTYSVEVYAAGNDKSYAATSTFKITPAPIKSAKADQAIYAYTKDVIEPTFTGYTKDDFTGLPVALSADNAKITYKKWDGKTYVKDAAGKETDEIDWSASTVVPADQLKEVGTYQATIDLPQDFKNFADATPMVTAEFQISEKAAFTDVDANAWYAESVYTAADFGYMTGLAGTKLFMPESQITRAEVAQVFANMAGQEKDPNKTYPTKFSDVEADAWYAQAIAWASQAGIVGGYDGGNVFGTFDNATREQIATMIYRYAKAQGMDVTVKDEAAALAKYADGASVSDYAKTAMAYCIEQGVFGVDVDTLRPQDFMSRAEMAATSVRVQPDGAKQEL